MIALATSLEAPRVSVPLLSVYPVVLKEIPASAETESRVTVPAVPSNTAVLAAFHAAPVTEALLVDHVVCVAFQVPVPPRLEPSAVQYISVALWMIERSPLDWLSEKE